MLLSVFGACSSEINIKDVSLRHATPLVAMLLKEKSLSDDQQCSYLVKSADESAQQSGCIWMVAEKHDLVAYSI